MCNTKIVATIGPASDSEAVLEQLIQAGVSVVRFNFSHGTVDEHVARAETVRRIARTLNRHVAVLVDLQGPKIRIARFKQGKVALQQGQTFILDAGLADGQGDSERVGLDYPQLIDDLEPQQTLLLDDGRVQLKVVAVDKAARSVTTQVMNSATLSDRKGVNLLGGGLSAPALTDKDKADIQTAALIQADFLAVSFPRCADDIHTARKLAVAAGCQADIVAKVERAEVVASEQAMDAMIQATDVVMVARGDLGVEIGDARLPQVQKQLIRRCRYHGKPVITATQMLESMIHNPLPTRAEVMDVANAVLDGSDALMLSAESAAGDYPLEAVQAMVRVAAGAEAQAACASADRELLRHHCVDAGRSFTLNTAVAAAVSTRQAGIAVVTRNGQAVSLMSRCQGRSPLWALSDDSAVLRKLALLRGVIPVYMGGDRLDADRQVSDIERLLYSDALARGVHTLVLIQMQSIEGCGELDICRLIGIKQDYGEGLSVS